MPISHTFEEGRKNSLSGRFETILNHFNPKTIAASVDKRVASEAAAVDPMLIPAKRTFSVLFYFKYCVWSENE